VWLIQVRNGAPVRYKKKSRRVVTGLFRARLRALRSVDDAVAATIRQLRKLGELDTTYVMFTSDNGFGLGEHRLLRKNTLLDEALDVPLVVRGPGVAHGEEVTATVSLLDVPATILDLTGAHPQRPPDGLSLVPLLDGEGTLERDTILTQTGTRSRIGWEFRGATTERYLLGHRARDPDAGVLFDRRTDPHALINHFADPAYAEVRAELASRTRVLRSCEGPAGCNRVFGAVPEPTGRR
jgi:N-acetylglucosamine-6-sulfatase